MITLRRARRPAKLFHDEHAVTTTAALKRGAEAFDIAFVLLGGRRAANDYLDTTHPGLGGVPRERSNQSALGLIEVVRVMRRDALIAARAQNMPPHLGPALSSSWT